MLSGTLFHLSQSSTTHFSSSLSVRPANSCSLARDRSGRISPSVFLVRTSRIRSKLHCSRSLVKAVISLSATVRNEINCLHTANSFYSLHFYTAVRFHFFQISTDYVFHSTRGISEPKLDLLPASQGVIAQLVEQTTGIADVTGSIPDEALKSFLTQAKIG